MQAALPMMLNQRKTDGERTSKLPSAEGGEREVWLSDAVREDA